MPNNKNNMTNAASRLVKTLPRKLSSVSAVSLITHTLNCKYIYFNHQGMKISSYVFDSKKNQLAQFLHSSFTK